MTKTSGEDGQKVRHVTDVKGGRDRGREPEREEKECVNREACW